jgi:aspartyl protease family protein
MHRAWFGAALALLSLSGFAQTVSMSGSLGDKALLLIDGKPRTVAVGSTVQGVKLLGVTGSDAVVEIGGKRVTLSLGGAQANLGGGGSDGTGSQIVMTAGLGGHFTAGGSINGKAVNFLVDTGATSVSLSESVAERIGLDYRKAQRGMASTANGPVVVHAMSLSVVRIGDVQVYNVDAVIVPAPMEQVLLGNSFLTRFQMKRENDKLTLERRF